MNMEQFMKGALNAMGGVAGMTKKVQNLTHLAQVPVAHGRDLAVKFASEVNKNSKRRVVLIPSKKPHGTAVAGTNPKPDTTTETPAIPPTSSKKSLLSESTSSITLQSLNVYLLL